MKLWINDVRLAPERYIWCKSIKSALICLILIGICFSTVGCIHTQKTTIEYVEVPVEKVKCCGTSGVEYAPQSQGFVAIICSECGKQLGSLPVIKEEVYVPYETIIEKEVIVEVPVEVIVEKEIIKTVYIEKEVALSECSVITWEEVLNLKTGDKLENVFIIGNSFVSKFTNELYPAGYQTYWTHNAKNPKVFSMSSVCILKMNYGEKVDNLLADYYTWGNIGIVTGTIENIIWNIDEYGNKTVEIVFAKNGFELKTFIDFCPISE
jgi:hypothetical protein